ncbi:hypothetical protein [Gloeothece verrucosa]|uniref:Uncharacterized protein n=1 Tax=Gloeothece verrucosa (strain PCC 7822) TaxID=497965 RepID=E0UKU2_GLOV7|nr:hypothetical protein [Gloeothece verrucosa]ADN17572.1 conserved hypothetical protein [Gloeothece verrucosa PCC 7822]
MNKRLKIAILSFLLIFVVKNPVKAQLGKIWGDFYSYTIDLQNYVTDNASKTLKPLEQRVQGAIQESTGELNLPNPILAGERVANEIYFDSLSDKFENNSELRAQLTENEIDRVITLGAVASDWGESGQVRLKTKLQNAETTLNKIDKYSQDAEDIYTNALNKFLSNAAQLTGIEGITASLNTNTFKLQLQTIKIQTETAKFLSENVGQNIKTNQFLLYSNLNLNNIASQIEQINRDSRVNASAETARLLKVTFQTDLYGKPIEVKTTN